MTTMAIDGRDIKRRTEAAGKQPDAFQSGGVKFAAALIVYVPLALLLALTYWVGTFKMLGMGGGVGGGLISVLSTAATVAVIWFWRKNHRR